MLLEFQFQQNHFSCEALLAQSHQGESAGRATASLCTSNGVLLPSMMNSTHNPGLRDDSVYPVETLHYPKEYTHIQQKSVTTKLVYKTVTGFIEINTKLHRFSLLTQE